MKTEMRNKKKSQSNEKIKRSSGNGLAMFSRADLRSFVLETNRDIQLEAPKDVNVKIDNLAVISPDPKTKRARRYDSKSKKKYIEFISTNSGNVYIEESPEKQGSPGKFDENEVRFKGIPSLAELRQQRPELFEAPIFKEFEFTITNEEIQNCAGKKRPQSQNTVVGRSAEDIFKDHGVIITSQHKNQFHHAHRQGWSLAGLQTKENMDPSTAGSNYTTLLTVEAPLKAVLKSENIPSMRVQGKLIFHPLVPLPMEIIYTLSWGNNRQAEIKISPLNHRVPVLQENYVAEMMLKAVRSPEEKKSSANITSQYRHIMLARQTRFSKEIDEIDLDPSLGI